MTEQEAEVFVGYLTKVWGIRSGSQWHLSEQGAKPDHRKQLLRFSGYVCDEVKLRAIQLYEEDVWSYTLVHEVEGQQTGEFLHFHHGQLFLGQEGDEAHEERARQFAARWLPWFRRGCWLMGRSIGATAEEKAHWCTDFATEELEAWNVQAGPDDVVDDGSLARESRRFVAAFGIETWSCIEESAGQMRIFTGRVQGISIKWLQLWDGSLVYCVVRDSHATLTYGPGYEKIGAVGIDLGSSRALDVMARGLYRLGVEDKAVLRQLSHPLAAHEKLELRHSMTPEFWAKAWLKEEGEEETDTSNEHVTHTMTEQEQEADTLARRLERVWGPEGECETYWDESQFKWYIKFPSKNSLTFHDSQRYGTGGKRGQMLTLWVRLGSGYFIVIDWLSTSAQLEIYRWEGESLSRHEIDDSLLQSQEFQDFKEQYVPFFRRGCWLSGCPIEATAHEKAEWMQGFSQEELQAWNLKV